VLASHVSPSVRLATREGLEKIIVHGHTPKEKIEKFPYRINIDTGSFYSGNLSFLLIENEKLSFINTLSN